MSPLFPLSLAACQVLFKDARTLDLQGDCLNEGSQLGCTIPAQVKREQVLAPGAVAGAGQSAPSLSALAIWVGSLKSIPS